MMRAATLRAPTRIIVDPNGASRRDPQLTIVDFRDADRVPVPGETVLAHQPDEDGSDFVGSAEVTDVDHSVGLIYLRVDWSSFKEIPAVHEVEAGVLERRGTLHTRIRVRGHRVARPIRATEHNGALIQLRTSGVPA